MSRFQVDGSNHILPFNNDRLLTWDKTIVKLDDQIIYRELGGEIINVILNSIESNPAAAILTKSLVQEKTFSILLLDNDGKINAFKTINKPLDKGLPKIFFTGSSLLLLNPEEQLIQVYNYDGSRVIEYYLYNDKSWSHEKRILPTRDAFGDLTLLGMKSADLKNSQNVSQFKLEDKVEFLTDLPLTIPYLFSISAENISAIIGTKSIAGTFQQKPFLVFLDKNQRIINEPIELTQLPQKIIWFKDELVLIHRKHLLIYNADEKIPPHQIQFKSRNYPFNAFINDESILIVSGNGIDADQNGNYYDSIELIEYNPATNSVSTHPLQDGPIRKVEYFPTDSTSIFYLLLDNQLVHLRISK